MKTNSQSGFSIIELLLVVVALGLIGFAGHYVYQTNKAVDTLNSKADQTTASTTDTKAAIAAATTATVASATTATDTPTTAPIVTPEVKTSSDLTTASTTLDQTDPTTSNSNDVAELDAELASF